MNSGIFNLKQFLGVLSLVEDPSIEMGETDLIIKSGKTEINYAYCGRDVLRHIPDHDKVPTLPSVDVSFELSETVLSGILKAAGVMNLTQIGVVGEGGKIKIAAFDGDQTSRNKISQAVGETEHDFTFVFEVDTINKLLRGTYDVEISKSKFSHWISRDTKIEYWVSCVKKGSAWNG